MEGTIGEIRGFAGNFAPRTWAFCAGQLLAISQNTALFSIIGTTYGGDGRTTFGLPDLRGRVPISSGTGPGLSTHPLGQRSGVESVSLTLNELPSHSHSAMTTLGGSQIIAQGTIRASSSGSTSDPEGNYPADPGSIGPNPIKSYAPDSDTNMALDAVSLEGTITGTATTNIGNTGGSQYHNNMQPYLIINWIICLMGVFPSRN